MKCLEHKEKKLEMCAEQVNGLSKLMNLAHHWMEKTQNGKDYKIVLN